MLSLTKQVLLVTALLASNTTVAEEVPARTATQFLMTNSNSINVTTLQVINESPETLSVTGTLFNKEGVPLGSVGTNLGSVLPQARLSLSAIDLENLFNIPAWQGPAMLEVESNGRFSLLSRLVSPSGLTSNTNCVTEDIVHNVEGTDSSNLTYVRLINTGTSTITDITGTLVDEGGETLGQPNQTLVESLPAKAATFINGNQLSGLFESWTGNASLSVSRHPSLRLLNLNLTNDTFINFSCFEQVEGPTCNNHLRYGAPNSSDQLLCREGYALGYNYSRKAADWVAYRLTPEIHDSANVPRQDDYRTDEQVPEAYRTFNSDYSGSGYDRGHLVSSASLDANEQMNSETFLLSNISPQDPDMNRAGWLTLENWERQWATERGEIFVYVGAVFSDGAKEVIGDGLDVPTHFYKVLFDPTLGESTAYLFPNEPVAASEVSGLRNTVDSIELISGQNFLRFLRDDVEETIESTSVSWE